MQQCRAAAGLSLGSRGCQLSASFLQGLHTMLWESIHCVLAASPMGLWLVYSHLCMHVCLQGAYLLLS
jgi:hypothetical protein